MPGQPSPVVLVLGDEELLAARAVAEVLAAARAADPGTEVRELAGGDLTVGEFAEAISPSLFGGSRAIAIRAGQDVKKDVATALIEYAKHPEPDVVLVVAHLGGAKGRALADGLRKVKAAVLPVPKITRHRDRVDFVRAEFRRLAGGVTEEGAEALISAVGNDLRELVAACSQLVSDTGGRVDGATVARYYRGKAEVSGFAVADAVMAGDVATALESLRWAMHSGVDAVPIADAIAAGVRTVARVAAAGRGSAFQLASSLGMPAWKVERAQRQSRGWTAEGLVDAMRVAAECNAAVKGGADDRAYALERTVFAVVAARSGGTPPGRSGGMPPGGGR